MASTTLSSIGRPADAAVRALARRLCPPALQKRRPPEKAAAACYPVFSFFCFSMSGTKYPSKPAWRPVPHNGISAAAHPAWRLSCGHSLVHPPPPDSEAERGNSFPIRCPVNSPFGLPVRFFNGLPKPAHGGIKGDKLIQRNAIQRRHFFGLINIRHRLVRFPF